jgi:hypothetical protein
MYRSIRLYILHRFGCEKCYEHTKNLVDLLDEAQFRIRLMEINGDKNPETDIEYIDGLQAVCMYLNNGKFKYYVYDGYDYSTVNNAESVVTTLQEATEFYAKLANKYRHITDALFKVNAFHEDEITEFGHKYYHTEPYEITYIVGFDPNVSDEDKERILNLMKEEAGSVDEDIEYKYNIETKIKKRGCSTCQ